MQVLLGILLPAVPAAVFLAGGMELVIRLKWGILAAWGILLAGIFAVGKETGGKKGEDEEENGEDWEIMFREGEESRKRNIQAQQNTFFRKNGIRMIAGHKPRKRPGGKKTRMRCIRSFLPGGRSIR